MTEQERQDHIAMLRKRALVPFRKNVLETVAGGVEWRVIKARTSRFAVAVGVIVFGGVTLYATWRMGVGSAVVAVSVVLGIAYLIAVQYSKGPDQETVLSYDEERHVLEAPMAGLEIDATVVTKLTVREVGWARKRMSANDPLDVGAAVGWQEGARIWRCVYAFVGDQSHLLLAECSNHAAMSEMRSVVRRFAERLGKPLVEPERHHAPTTFE